MSGGQLTDHFSLQPIRILILIHQNIVEPTADFRCYIFILQHFGPVEQQVIIIEDILLLLGINVSGEQCAQLAFPFSAPRKSSGQD